jgi:hypothetical protein
VCPRRSRTGRHGKGTHPPLPTRSPGPASLVGNLLAAAATARHRGDQSFLAREPGQ